MRWTWPPGKDRSRAAEIDDAGRARSGRSSFHFAALALPLPIRETREPRQYPLLACGFVVIRHYQISVRFFVEALNRKHPEERDGEARVRVCPASCVRAWLPRV